MLRLLMLRVWPVMALAAVVLTGCETTSQSDATNDRLSDVDQRLVKVERQVNNQGLLQLSARIDAEDAQIRELRNSVEELQNSNEQLRKQQRDLYADLDRRLTALQAGATAGGGAGVVGGASAGSGAGVGPAAPGGSGPVTGAGDAGGDQAAYAQAFDSLKANDYSTAIARFKDFLRQYPQSLLAGNAEYWLGEAYYVTRDLDDAAASFRAVGDQYPKSSKVPDALVKLGITQVDQQHLTDARATLNAVVQRYPGTDAARLAGTRLQNLPPDQH